MNKNNYVIGPKIQTDEFFLFWVEEKRKNNSRLVTNQIAHGIGKNECSCWWRVGLEHVFCGTGKGGTFQRRGEQSSLT